ncbi:V-type proton ATPase subunit S1 [Ostrinia nubilalis]|uniref:V-type proton ATPase subunit S1 n=1 Tax=Ostrinia nubilalis TaxID=29057 RepID=UPI0030824290
MACSRLVFVTLVLSVVSSFAVKVPVFLWKNDNEVSIRSNPLRDVSSHKFDSIVKNELQDNPFMVVFIEETLSVEDFSRKNDEGETSFPYLESKIGDATYLPSVENPLKVLNKASIPEETDHVKLTENGLSADISGENDKFLFINLKDAKENEPRDVLLRRHNDFIEDMVSKLQKRYSSVVAVYTAHYPSWTTTHSRVRRQATNETEVHGHDYTLNGLRLYVQAIEFGAKNTTGSLSDLVSNSSTFNTTELSTTMEFKEATLTLSFRMQGGYWFFETVTFSQDGSEHELTATSEVYALDGFSYRCGDRITFASTNQTEYNVTFIDMKVQPFFKTLNASAMEFGDAFNCVGFFSVPIWSGLFVVFILLSITFYGIMMMMDIRTMDRFDDPKGKTITINASE